MLPVTGLTAMPRWELDVSSWGMAPGASQPPVPKPATGVELGWPAGEPLMTDAAIDAMRGREKRCTGILGVDFRVNVEEVLQRALDASSFLG